MNNKSAQNIYTETCSVFLSYNHSIKKIADDIQQKLRNDGYTVVRDLQVMYKGNFKEFMKRIRETDYALLLVNDEYLESINCMFEITELLRDDNYADKYLPIVIEGTKLYSSQDINTHLMYWMDRKKKLEKDIKGLSPESLGSSVEDAKRIAQIQIGLDNFLNKLRDINHIVIPCNNKNSKAMFCETDYQKVRENLNKIMKHSNPNRKFREHPKTTSANLEKNANLSSDKNTKKTSFNKINSIYRENTDRKVITEPRTCPIELKIDAEFESFSKTAQENILAAIGKLLRTTKKLQIIQKRPGSVYLTIDGLTHEEAEKLLWAVRRGNLHKLNVIDAQIKEKTIMIDKGMSNRLSPSSTSTTESPNESTQEIEYSNPSVDENNFGKEFKLPTTTFFKMDYVFYPEEYFHKILVFERKRNERSNNSLLIMFLDISNFESGFTKLRIANKLIKMLSIFTREIDIKGWYKKDNTLAILYTEIADVGSEFFRSRMYENISEVLKPEEVKLISITCLSFPEDLKRNKRVIEKSEHTNSTRANEKLPISSSIAEKETGISTKTPFKMGDSCPVYEPQFAVKNSTNTDNTRKRTKISKNILFKKDYTFYPEEYFRKMLVLERKRSERSNNSFIIMFLDVSNFKNGFTKHRVTNKLCKMLSQNTREIDIKGWYKKNNTLGILYTEINDIESEFLKSRMYENISKTLKPDSAKLISITCLSFPEDFKKKPDIESEQNAIVYNLSRSHFCKQIALFFKRQIDILGGLTALILSAPLFIVIPILIKLTSKGPVFYKQKRIGKYGKSFTLLKFRTMRVDNNPSIDQHYIKKYIAGQKEESVKNNDAYKIKDDPRVTKIGKFLRKSSLDGLPQLINVLIGHMSLVGPRPAIQYEVDEYDMWHKRRVIEVKPGITGIWQVKGRSVTDFDNMVRMDIQYIKRWTPVMDLKLILQVPLVLFKTKGAV